MSSIRDPSFVKSFQSHRLGINWIEFSPNGRYLASASDDKNIILWPLNSTNTMCFKYSGHSDSVNSVALTNSFMVSASKDCTSRLWKLDRAEENSFSSEASLYRCHQSPINCVDINADETQFCTASDDKTVKIWSALSTNKSICTLSGEHTNWVRHARFSQLSPFLLSSCGDDGFICIWDIRTKDAAIKLTSKRKSTHFINVQWHPNCEYVMSSTSSDLKIRIWDLRYEKSIQSYQVHDSIISSACFHSSGNYLISSSYDQTCKILDIYQGRTMFTIKAHSGQVNSAQFSRKGDYFATAGQDRSILYWKSNLPEIDLDASTDEEDISRHNDETQINSFDSDLKSLQKHFNGVDINEKVNVSETKEFPKGEDSIESEDTTLDTNAVSILKCILHQLVSITDSILNIDQRLCTLEQKFSKLKV